ncbi:MAG: hypothetical protein FWH21_08635, partial [Kiritimatiellaeota bacterium]|nr:hypothetical protein [Kiritimatiellota bacterium]
RPLTDICPFTVFGAFNKGITNNNRSALLKALAGRMDIHASVPVRFDGIPVLNNSTVFGDVGCVRYGRVA